jgi:hypothetical protein
VKRYDFDKIRPVKKLGGDSYYILLGLNILALRIGSRFSLEVWLGLRHPVEGHPCAICKLPHSPRHPDPCLGQLPGVRGACCGHGDKRAAYIGFEDGPTIRGFWIDHESSDWRRSKT